MTHKLAKLTRTLKSLLKHTSRNTVPGTSIGDSIHKAAVIIILAARGPVGVRHYGVETGIGTGEALEDDIIGAGTVLMGGAYFTNRWQNPVLGSY